MALTKGYIANLKMELRSAITEYNEADNWRGASYTQQLLQQVDQFEKQMTTHNVDHENFPPEEPAVG